MSIHFICSSSGTFLINLPLLEQKEARKCKFIKMVQMEQLGHHCKVLHYSYELLISFLIIFRACI